MAAVAASLSQWHSCKQPSHLQPFPQDNGSGRLMAEKNLDTLSYGISQSSIEIQRVSPLRNGNDSGELAEPYLSNRLDTLNGHEFDGEQKCPHYSETGKLDPYGRDRCDRIALQKKSTTRLNDQLLPPSPSKEINDRQIYLPFPSQHPYFSHMSRFSLFPSFKSPDDPQCGDPKRSTKPIHCETPANAYNVTVVNKAKGSPYRREIQEYPHDSDKTALTWNGEGDYYQITKTLDGNTQPFYPTPPKTAHPNLRLREDNQRLELRTVNALRNIEREQWKTTYNYNYTGNGPSNTLKIDDHHKRMIHEITTNEDSRNCDMIPGTTPLFTQSRPLEGRYGQLTQQRSDADADSRFLEKKPGSNVSDAMDALEHLSLSEQLKCGYSKEVKLARDLKTADSSSETAINKVDKTEQWKAMHTEINLNDGWQVIRRKEELQHPEKAEGQDTLPKSVEGYIKLQEEAKHYLKDYQTERNKKFKDVANNNERKKLKFQYDPGQDICALRNKMDQMGTRHQPNAMNQHSTQVVNDHQRLQHLKDKVEENKTRFDTGLKFTTESISDPGTVKNLHDRQLENVAKFPKLWNRSISLVDNPQQNHRGDISGYIIKSNPFSLSASAEHALPEYRKAKPNMFSLSSSKPILKTSTTPPKREANRSISFDKIVRVATSNDSKHQMPSYPLQTNTASPTTNGPSIFTPSRSQQERSPSKVSGPKDTTIRCSSMPHPQDHLRRNFDLTLDGTIGLHRRYTEESLPRPQSSLLEIQNGWTKPGADD